MYCHVPIGSTKLVIYQEIKCSEMHQYQFLLTDTDTDTLISKISDKVADTLEQNWHGTLMLVAHMIRKSIHFVSHYILQNTECFRWLANSKLNM